MRFIPLYRLIMLLSSVMVVACGGSGGEGGSGGVGEPDNTLTLVDSLPRSGTVTNANAPRFSLSHLAPDGLNYSYSAPCSLGSSRIINRDADDISGSSNSQLIDHLLTCADDLTLDSNQVLTLEDSSSREVSVSFTSHSAITPASNRIIVDEEETLPLNSIGSVTALTLLEALVDDADLSPIEAVLVNSLLNEIASEELPNLFDPITEFDVVTQTVRYESIDPRGNRVDTLSGLVAFPETSGVSGFTPKNDIVLLSHSTGLTPSEKGTTASWYNLAVVLASRGYLVVAPDNFGLGNTGDHKETYLLAKQTGINSVDLISAVINSGNYNDVINQASTEKNVAIVGYSQGGHSAVAAWQEILHGHQGKLNTTRLYAGAGPYNVYETVKGVINYANGTCQMDAYCRYVNDELVDSYAIERILPPLLEYTETGLGEADVIDGTQLTSTFTSGFMENHSDYNALKALLQLSSYTNIRNPDVAFLDPTLDVYFYHSDYDRLVAPANTQVLAQDLMGYVQSVTDVSGNCNSNNMQLLFANVSEVGVIHGICGIMMIDDILSRFD